MSETFRFEVFVLGEDGGYRLHQDFATREEAEAERARLLAADRNTDPVIARVLQDAEPLT